MKKLLGILSVAVILTACGGGDQTKEAQAETPKKGETAEVSKCIYTYNNETTGVFWKAYKHSAKVGVNGRFDAFDVNFVQESGSIEALLEGMKMSVDVQSVNSNDTLRDGKLRRSFFGMMSNTSMITGEIMAINGTTGKLKMKMNDVEKEVPFDLAISGEEVELRTTIDILDFAANEAFDTLGEACAEKHTGADGVKKFWSEVDIYIKTIVNKDCKE